MRYTFTRKGGRFTVLACVNLFARLNFQHLHADHWPI